MSKSEIQNDKRREFLRGSALLGAGAALVAGTPAVASTTDEVSVEAALEKKPQGYRLTKHISAYYRTAAS